MHNLGHAIAISETRRSEISTSSRTQLSMMRVSNSNFMNGWRKDSVRVCFSALNERNSRWRKGECDGIWEPSTSHSSRTSNGTQTRRCSRRGMRESMVANLAHVVVLIARRFRLWNWIGRAGGSMTGSDSSKVDRPFIVESILIISV